MLPDASLVAPPMAFFPLNSQVGRRRTRSHPLPPCPLHPAVHSPAPQPRPSLRRCCTPSPFPPTPALAPRRGRASCRTRCLARCCPAPPPGGTVAPVAWWAWTRCSMPPGGAGPSRSTFGSRRATCRVRQRQWRQQRPVPGIWENRVLPQTHTAQWPSGSGCSHADAACLCHATPAGNALSYLFSHNAGGDSPSANASVNATAAEQAAWFSGWGPNQVQVCPLSQLPAFHAGLPCRSHQCLQRHRRRSMLPPPPPHPADVPATAGAPRVWRAAGVCEGRPGPAHGAWLRILAGLG